MSLTLVTGATGWLGTRLVDVLLRGLPDDPRFAAPTPRTLRALASPDAPLPKLFSNAPGLAVVRGDLRDGSGLGEFTQDAKGATLCPIHRSSTSSVGVRSRYGAMTY